MTATREPRRTATAVAGRARSSRDTAIDLVRAVCVAGVVIVHALMVGVTLGPGGPSFVNAAEGAWWFAPLTLLLPLMPLFFVIGGFSGLVAYRRHRDRGGSAVAFLADRVHRLVLPAIVAIAAAAFGLGALAAAGVPAELVAIAGFRLSQPLWFLAVFLGCQALLPALVAAHERWPVRSLIALMGAAALVDGIRFATDVDAIGALNFAFVWLALQQLGFFLADGRIDSLSRRARILTIGGAVAALAVAVIGGHYSANLVANQAPPTLVLIIVGIATMVAFSLLRVRLTRLSERPRVARVTAFVTSRTMTIYLWHMPVLLAMAGAAALLAQAGAVSLPVPSSLEWWATRPVWLAVALALTVLVAVPLSRAERVVPPAPTASARRVTTGVLVAIAAIVLLLAVGVSVISAALSTGLLAIALLAARADAGGGLAVVTRPGPRVLHGSAT